MIDGQTTNLDASDGGLTTGPAPDPMPRDPTNLQTLESASRWLSQHATNITSQTGEDGILAKALSLLPDCNRWCIEFGAWDGKFLSNTYDLVDRHGYHVALIEGDPKKYRLLCSTYPHRDRAILVNAYVGWSTSDSLDQILEPFTLPAAPDLLSIDVDGNYYHIWKATSRLRPKLVLIEYNPTIAPWVDFVQPADPRCNQGNSAAALVRLGKEKGYELIALTDLNLLFVDSQYYAAFLLPDNSLELMCRRRCSSVSFGYDGTVFLHGDHNLPWHGMRLSPRSVQVLPRFLRGYPPTYGVCRKFMFYTLWVFLQPRRGIKGTAKHLLRHIIAAWRKERH